LSLRVHTLVAFCPARSLFFATLYTIHFYCAQSVSMLCKLLDTYGKIFLVEADNVGSNQMHKIRISLRGTAVILMVRTP